MYSWVGHTSNSLACRIVILDEYNITTNIVYKYTNINPLDTYQHVGLCMVHIRKRPRIWVDTLEITRIFFYAIKTKVKHNFRTLHIPFETLQLASLVLSEPKIVVILSRRINIKYYKLFQMKLSQITTTHIPTQYNMII